MKCCIMKDLLPSYIDGLTSEETNKEIKKHLEDCVSCRTVYEQMSAMLPAEPLPEKKDIDFLRQLRGRIHRKYAVMIFLTFVLMAGLMIFLKTYDLPVPYDPKCMTTETSQMAYVPSSFGLREWRNLNMLDPVQQAAVDAGECETIEVLHLLLTSSTGSDGMTSSGRTIWRNGEEVRVVYYCYTMSLWNRLFLKKSQFECRKTATGEIYDKLFYRSEVGHYGPKQMEIYYLPIGNMNQLDRLSDEEFDAKKEDAVLVFQGKI